MGRLCALVPPPRKHLVTYHGVLAPASGLRSRWPRRSSRSTPRGCVGSRRRAGYEHCCWFRTAVAGGEVVGGGARGRRCCSGRCQDSHPAPPAEAWSAEDSATCCARSGSRYWSLHRSAAAYGSLRGAQLQHLPFAQHVVAELVTCFTKSTCSASTRHAAKNAAPFAGARQARTRFLCQCSHQSALPLVRAIRVVSTARAAHTSSAHRS